MRRARLFALMDDGMASQDSHLSYILKDTEEGERMYGLPQLRMDCRHKYSRKLLQKHMCVFNVQTLTKRHGRNQILKLLAEAAIMKS